MTVPVSIITGFLGSGKTTLLNHLLKSGALRDTALIINEFGDVGIDQLLVETADEGIVEMSDGCLCCTIRGDLIDTLTRLLNRPQRPERIVIETTGLADPAPILHAVMGHPVLVDQLRLDGVITVVDAVNGMATLDVHEEAVKQVAVADRIVLTKSDLVDGADALRQRVLRLNPMASLLDTQTRAPGFDDLFNCGVYNPQTKTADVERWLNDAAVANTHHDHHHHHEVNRHDERIRAMTLISPNLVDAAALATFIDLLRSAHGPKLLRVKGIIGITEDPDRPVVIHGVQQVFHPPATLPHWPNDDRRTRLVMITKDMPQDYIRRLFDAITGTMNTDTPDRQAIENNPLAVPGVSFKS